MDQEKFWLVWSPTGTKAPQHKHVSNESAIAEAKRLARAHPGQEFMVMEATDGFVVNDMRHTVFAHPAAPF